MTVSERAHRSARTDPVATTLREGIDARGVTLSWLHTQLSQRGTPVSMATLSYWRSGARRPEGTQSMTALAVIEEVLRLDAGSLTGAVVGTNRTGPLGPIRFPLETDELERKVAETFRALGAAYPGTTREITTHSVTDVGPDGAVVRCVGRSVLQSTTGTTTAIPFLHITPGEAAAAPVLSAVSGGRIAMRYSHPDGEVHGALFELEQPLEAPATTVIESMAEQAGNAPPTMETGHAVGRPCRELLLWTRFHPDALPDWIEEKVDTPQGVQFTPLHLNGSSAVHRLHHNFGPGAVQISWGYGERPAQPD
ncbi:hypothetical protein [Microbacterium sp.]|uniref:hypothetical protein n=1 Tax=Microbacterium sp. TaxID=51671 RepID=UPI0039E72063